MEQSVDNQELFEAKPLSRIDRIRITLGLTAMAAETGMLAASTAGVSIGKTFLAAGIPIVAQSIPVFLDIDQGRKG